VKQQSWRVALAVLATVALALGVALGGAGAANSKPKVAVILSVGLKDTGYGLSALSGITKIQKQLGLEVASTDHVKPADFATALAGYASRGYGLVIADGVEFQDAAKEVATQFPDVQFLVINGFLGIPPNLSAMDFRWEQAGYLGGLAAGLATKTNVVGNIGGIKIPPIERLFYGFQQGLKAVNPKAKLVTSWVGSFTDPGKAKTVAEAQISKKVDVIWAIADSGNTGIFQAVTGKKVLAIGYGSDEYKLAPKHMVTTTLVDYGKTIFEGAKLAMEGKLEPKAYVNGFEEGVFGLAPTRGLMPKAMVAKLNPLVAKAKSGAVKIKPMPSK